MLTGVSFLSTDVSLAHPRQQRYARQLRFSVLACALSVCMLLVTLSSSAQSTGSITGLVTDAQGLVIAGANVTVTSSAGVTRSTATNNDGFYTFPQLPVGSYQMKIAQSGMKTIVENVQLQVSETRTVNVKLEVSGSAQEVFVQGDAGVAVDLVSGTLGDVVNEKTIDSLPLNGRNWTQLALLQPGVQNFTSVQKGVNLIESRSNRISINGGRVSSNQFLLDGSPVEGIFHQTPSGASGNFLGLDTIQEFKVVTNSYGAEYGQASGGVITAVTKTGTNNFHGSAFEYLRNDQLDARDYFAPKRPEFKRNQFGASAGGPIRKNSAYFFGGYEGYRERLGVSGLQVVPDQNAHSGLVPNAQGQLVDVGLQPIIAKYLASPAFPLPNQGSVGGGLGLYSFTENQVIDENYYSGRVDLNLTKKDLVFARYSFLESDPVLVPNTVSAGFPTQEFDRNQYLTLSHTRAFSSNLLGRALFSFVRTRTFGTNHPSFSVPSELEAVPGTGFPLLNIGGMQGLGANFSLPRNLIQNVFGVNYDMAYIHGRHNFKFGFVALRYQANTFSSSRTMGQFFFANLTSFLQDKAQQANVAVPGSLTGDSYRNTLYGFYVQDDLRVSRTFTVNVGLRYEPTTAIQELHGKTLVIDKINAEYFKNFSLPRVVPSDIKIGQSNFYPNPAKTNFMPRLGFAWDIFGNGSTSLRGGFGTYFDPIVGFYFNRIYANPPFNTIAIIPNPVFPGVFSAPGTSLTPPPLLDPVQQDFKNPYLMQWTVSVQRSLPWNSVLTVGYAGSRGYDLLSGYEEANPAVPVFAADGSYSVPLGSKRRSPEYSSMLTATSLGESRYHSGQLSLSKGLSHGTQFNISYTYSRLIDNTGPENGSTNAQTNEAPGPMVPWDVNRDMGLSSLHVAHTLVASALYDLPFLRTRGGPLGFILGGWGLGGIVNARTGLPFTPAIQADRAGSLNVFLPGYQRPNLAPGRSIDSIVQGGPVQYFDPTAFTLPPAGTFGNVGRNVLIGPGLFTVDMFGKKEFRTRLLGEAGGIEFRVDAFNLFNRANFDIPNRIVFAGLPSNVTEAPLATAGRITNTVTPARQIQLSVRISF